MYVSGNKKERLNAFINESPTIAEKAGADIPAPAHKAVMYDVNGDIVLATDGDKAIGLLLSDTLDPIKAGETVTVLISAIGLMEAGGAIAKGDPVTVNTSGQGIPAAAGAAFFGRALTAAGAAGELIQIRI